MELDSTIVSQPKSNQQFKSTVLDEDKYKANDKNGKQVEQKLIVQDEQINIHQKGYSKENYLSNKSINNSSAQGTVILSYKIDDQNVKKSVQIELQKSNTKRVSKTVQQSISMKDSRNKSRLRLMEQQKQAILTQLREIDSQIYQIKSQNNSQKKEKRNEQQISEQQALKKAKQLVKYYKNQKIIVEEKKRKETQRSLQFLKQQEQQFRKFFLEQAKRKSEEKRRSISIKIQQTKKQKQQRNIINIESNKLVVQLKKQQQMLKQKAVIPQEINQLQDKKINICERKQQFNAKQIQQHQKKYLQMKKMLNEQKNSRKTISLSHPVQKFSKNIWAEKLEEQDFKKRQEETIKELNKKIYLDKRLKYGQIVKSIFVPKRKQRRIEKFDRKKQTNTPDLQSINLLPNLPKISQSQKRINDTTLMKKYRENKRVSSSPNTLKKQKKKRILTQKSPEQIQQDKQRLFRLAELRKQTNQRLKKLENKSVDMILTQKPKYQNYLGSFKQKRIQNPKQWKKIIQNSKLSNEQKYTQMIKRAALLQQKAKQRQQCRREGDEQSVDLYIHSIQAKLALLQKF